MIYDLFKEEKFVYDLKRFNRFIQNTHNPKAKIMVMNLKEQEIYFMVCGFVIYL